MSGAILSGTENGSNLDLEPKMGHTPDTPAVPMDRKRFEKAPCYVCGYNGSGYYQPASHPCAKLYHADTPAVPEPVAYRCTEIEPLLPPNYEPIVKFTTDRELAEMRARRVGEWSTEPLFSEAQMRAALDRAERAEAERDEAWRRANRAESKMRAWENFVIVRDLPMRAVENKGWGPGENDLVAIPQITPEKLTDILDRATTAEAALSAAEGVRPRVKHKKRGSTYEVIGTGKMQAEDWEDMTCAFDEGGYIGGDSVDMRDVVIYRSESDGSLWVRPVEEFNDGRFTALEGA